MLISLKKKSDLTAEQRRAVDAILNRFGIGGVLAIGYVEDQKTGKSTTMVPCIQTGEMLRFDASRLQSPSEIATLIPHELLCLLPSKLEGAFWDKEDVGSIDTLFDLVNVIED